MPDYLRKAIIHMKSSIDDYKIFDNRSVDAGQVTSLENKCAVHQNEIPARYLKLMKDYQTVAYVVIRNNEIVAEKYWEGYSEIVDIELFFNGKEHREPPRGYRPGRRQN